MDRNPGIDGLPHSRLRRRCVSHAVHRSDGKTVESPLLEMVETVPANFFSFDSFGSEKDAFGMLFYSYFVSLEILKPLCRFRMGDPCARECMLCRAFDMKAPYARGSNEIDMRGERKLVGDEIRIACPRR